MPTHLPPGTALAQIGSPDDYKPTRARKRHQCHHQRAHSQPLTVECAGGIQTGDVYLRVRQSWMDYTPLNLECARAAGLVITT